MQELVTVDELARRIMIKLEKHDKSLFTALELNLLKKIVAEWV